MRKVFCIPQFQLLCSQSRKQHERDLGCGEKGFDSHTPCKTQRWNPPCVTLNYSLMRAQRNQASGWEEPEEGNAASPPGFLWKWGFSPGERSAGEGMDTPGNCGTAPVWGHVPCCQHLCADPALAPTAMSPFQGQPSPSHISCISLLPSCPACCAHQQTWALH